MVKKKAVTMIKTRDADDNELHEQKSTITTGRLFAWVLYSSALLIVVFDMGYFYSDIARLR